MLRVNSRGQVVRVFTYTSNPMMRKHGADRHERTDAVRVSLDAIASAPRTSRYGAGYILRRRAK